MDEAVHTIHIMMLWTVCVTGDCSVHPLQRETQHGRHISVTCSRGSRFVSINNIKFACVTLIVSTGRVVLSSALTYNCVVLLFTPPAPSFVVVVVVRVPEPSDALFARALQTTI